MESVTINYINWKGENLFETLPENSQQIGFYSYGKLSPYSTGECRLHNQTMTLTTFYENETE